MALKKFPIPIPLDRWFNDIKSIEELRTILDSEAFQTATCILKESAGPSFSSLSQNGDSNNLRHAWYAGYRDAFADLTKLTKLPIDKQPLIDEWTHLSNP